MADPRNKPVQRVFTIEQPAAGAVFTITPNTGADWLIRALRFLYTADANVATRHVTLRLTDGVTQYGALLSGSQQTAGQARLYAGTYGNSSVIALGSSVSIPFPENGIWLPNGHSLTVAVDNIQAGDQFTVIAGHRIEFPLGPRDHVWPFMPLLLEESS